MIEISHKQAQHLIRQGMDRRLPDEQWSALQAHLERCPDCTAYRQRLAASERRLNHALQLRWGSARGPVRPVAEELLKRRRRLVKLRRFASRASWFVLAAVLLFGYIGYRRLTAPPKPEPLPVTLQRPTADLSGLEPTEASFRFRGLAALELHKDGNAEIYLLNASGGRADLTNLTQDHGSDTSPAWSPDGEWVAFLSDRSGKNELYVVSVAGSRLTQLTSTPEIEWQGPLEWSADGSAIALTGRRGLGGPSFLYLAGLDGSAPRSIGGTRGAQPWVRFSPSLPILAYVPNASQGGLEVVNTQTGWAAAMTGEDSGIFHYRAALQGAFDWSLGGRGLVYVADGDSETGSLLRLSPELTANGMPEAMVTGADTIDRLPRAGAFRAVSWVPNSLQVASLQDGDGDGCWTLRIDHAFNRQVAPRDITGLCVDGGLERSNWTADGNWLVLVGHTAENSAPGIYAVRPQSEEESTGKPGVEQPTDQIERLVDADAPAQPAGTDVVANANAGSTLRVRPSGRSLGITPRPAAAVGMPQPTPAPTILPQVGAPGLPEWVYFSVLRENGEQIFRSRVDGSQPEPLTPEDSRARCLRAKPDGTLAYVLEAAGKPGEIYRMNAGGKNAQPPTVGSILSEGKDPNLSPSYVCPVWSPDGTRLAALAANGANAYLSILTADGKTPPLYVRIEGISRSAPVWLSAGANPAHKILLVYPQGSQPARVVEIDLDQLPKGKTVIDNPGPALTVRLVLTGWQDAWGFSLSPDGEHIAALLVYYNTTSAQAGLTFGQLRVYRSADLTTIGAVPLNNFDPNTAGQGGLGWIDNDTAGLVRTIARVGSEKTIFERFDWHTNDIDTIARVEDLVYSTAWNARGWVLFAAESGLWAMDTTRENPTPVQLNGEVVSEVEWK